jgi:hypothetical protein
MSGGIAVKDENRGGVSPGLHKRSAEGWRTPRFSPGWILDRMGTAGPLLNSAWHS